MFEFLLYSVYLISEQFYKISRKKLYALLKYQHKS